MAKQKKILITITSLKRGGAEQVAATIATQLHLKQHDITILTLVGGGELLSELPKGIKVISLNTTSSMVALIGIARNLREISPSIIISFMPHGNMMAALARIITFSRSRHIMTEHSNPEITHNLGKGFAGKLMPWINMALYRTPYRIVAVSQGVANSLERYFRLPNRKIEVIYNPVGVKTSRRNCRPVHAWLSNKSTPVALAAGRLGPEKGFDTLIKAFEVARQKCPDLRLIIRGEGSERENLQHIIDGKGLSQTIDLPGHTDNIRAEMALCDTFVLSSRREGFGLVLVEAASQGAKIVSTNCNYGPSEIILNAEDGMLVPVDDIQALGSAIGRSAKLPPRSPNTFLADKFSVETSMDRYERLIE